MLALRDLATADHAGFLPTNPHDLVMRRQSLWFRPFVDRPFARALELRVIPSSVRESGCERFGVGFRFSFHEHWPSLLDYLYNFHSLLLLVALAWSAWRTWFHPSPGPHRTSRL